MNKTSGKKSTPLANRIKDLRIKNGLSQVLLAEQLGVSHAHIGFLETGKRKGSRELIIKIAEYFKIDPVELIQLQNQSDDFINPAEQLPQEEDTKYPDYIKEFMDMLVQIDKKICKDMIEEFKEQLNKKLYRLLTPYELKKVKQMTMDVKRKWMQLIHPNDEQKSLNENKEGFFQHSEKEIYFSFQLNDFALTLSFLYHDKNQVTLFENWLGQYSIYYIDDMDVTHLTEPQKIASFIWFSPSISTLEKFNYLVNNNIPLSFMSCNEHQLNWYIQQSQSNKQLDSTNNVSAS